MIKKAPLRVFQYLKSLWLAPVVWICWIRMRWPRAIDLQQKLPSTWYLYRRCDICSNNHLLKKHRENQRSDSGTRELRKLLTSTFTPSTLGSECFCSFHVNHNADREASLRKFEAKFFSTETSLNNHIRLVYTGFLASYLWARRRIHHRASTKAWLTHEDRSTSLRQILLALIRSSKGRGGPLQLFWSIRMGLELGFV